MKLDLSLGMTRSWLTVLDARKPVRIVRNLFFEVTFKLERECCFGHRSVSDYLSFRPAVQEPVFYHEPP